MRSRAAEPIILVALCVSFALAGDGEDEVRKERDWRDWTVKDLPRDPQRGIPIPISNEVILRNSHTLLKEHPDDKELKHQTVQFAKALVRPQAPPPLAWQILIEQGVLKDGMSMKEARRVLGRPTYDKEGHVRWYFNFHGMHVYPGLGAELQDGALKNWTLSEG
jgi:hypothetical protein